MCPERHEGGTERPRKGVTSDGKAITGAEGETLHSLEKDNPLEESSAERLNTRAVAGDFSDGPMLSRQKISENIKASFNRHPSLATDRLKIEVIAHGHAIINGEFDSEQDKADTLRLISEVHGVAYVTDNSVVRRRE